MRIYSSRAVFLLLVLSVVLAGRTWAVPQPVGGEPARVLVVASRGPDLERGELGLIIANWFERAYGLIENVEVLYDERDPGGEVSMFFAATEGLLLGCDLACSARYTPEEGDSITVGLSYWLLEGVSELDDFGWTEKHLQFLRLSLDDLAASEPPDQVEFVCYTALGRVYEARGETAPAGHLYSLALGETDGVSEEDIVKVFGLQAALLMEIGNYSSATLSLSRITELQPDVAAGHYELACCYSLALEREAALEAIETALDLEPENELFLRTREGMLRNPETSPDDTDSVVE